MMDDMQRLTTAACADLERLAAAAATMGYSSDSIPVPAHHLSSAVPPSTLAPAIVPQYPDPYDLSRAQQYAVARLSEYQPRAVYDQTRAPHPATTQQQHIITPAHAHTSRNSQYAVDRSNFGHVGNRSQQYGTVTASSSSAGVPGAIQYTDAKPVIANTSGIALTQPSLLPSTASSSLVTQAVTQAVMHFVQDGLVLESSGNIPAQTQEKKKKKEKKPDGELKEKKEKVLNDGDTLGEGTSTEGEAKINTEVPEPILIDGRKYYVCSVCDARFLRKYQFRRHLIAHTGEKRGALSLETKVEIIRRIQSGEKQVDLAMEYNVGRSTLSFIMKHAEKFLGVWKNGKFHPDSKRLRGAQREDVEEALYEWYKQALQMHITITGPILCQKAKDFAVKLGYKEFKATHGWLDRFKHRKNIVLGRGKPNKDKDNQDDSEDLKGDFTGQVLPSALMEYEANDVFHADEIGLLYRILPNKTSIYKGDRCAGGSKSKHRVTVLMCTNMTGTEKFPLLVIGKHPKPKCFKNVKSLPVQYLANSKSWMTTESFTAWLHDLDSWFVQQNRKVLLILPSRPIHPKAPKLNAVRVLSSPQTFIGPCKLGISHSLKRNYRRAVLETLLNFMEEESTKKKKKTKQSQMELNLLACLHLLAAAWHAVTDVTINNSFQRSGIGKYALWGMNLMPETNLGTENLELIHKLKSKGFKIPDGITFDEYVMFDDDVQICHLMDDDDIIAAVTGADLESSDSEDEAVEVEKVKAGSKDKGELTESGDTEPGEEVEDGPAMAEVDASLGTLRQHIQYQEGAQEMFRVLAHLEFLIHKGTSRPPLAITSSETTT
ncbi:tigger transposable element-derived protein 4-like isoform X1 [Homarus americanus]|uniref:tigger transposable element-derived protein 4-like isoform X1 n=1 Tax=Homarus americanus TaxID=6706 RepID=UPI001C462B7B|nr:tigger transposable element-derived protein 4-like isoform X1 [Homarus americanus]XP_042203873.1 tigger transposable element-derived protein 4-like isoform X1 [Homarus americanus]XP_042203874.1 tigger transposable element-derived protein 4-like isoform X1 [Homarus americanus]